MRKTLRVLLAPLLLVAAEPAAAEGYCVACFGPDAVYQCVIEGAPANAPPDPRNQILCIKTLATEGKHARCSVERFSAAGCNGALKTIAASSTPATPGATPPAGTPEGPVSGTQPGTAAKSNPVDDPEKPEAAPANAPPRTVEELAKSTAESTKKGLESVGETVKDTTKKAGDQIEGAGSAVGHAAKKTWDCLTSFFSDC